MSRLLFFLTLLHSDWAVLSAKGLKGGTLSKIRTLSWRSKFFQKQVLTEMGGKDENGRLSSPESVRVYLCIIPRIMTKYEQVHIFHP